MDYKAAFVWTIAVAITIGVGLGAAAAVTGFGPDDLRHYCCSLHK